MHIEYWRESSESDNLEDKECSEVIKGLNSELAPKDSTKPSAAIS
jgi:hypothetical protein